MQNLQGWHREATEQRRCAAAQRPTGENLAGGRAHHRAPRRGGRRAARREPAVQRRGVYGGGKGGEAAESRVRRRYLGRQCFGFGGG